MKCPKCGEPKTKVRVTNDHGNSVERVRLCEKCRTWFRTTEEGEVRD